MAHPAGDSLQQGESHLYPYSQGLTKIMLNPGPAKKVTIHLNEDTAARKDFLYNEIFAFLLARGVAGATLVRPDAGFGSHRRVPSSPTRAATRRNTCRCELYLSSRPESASLMPDLRRLLPTA